MLYLLGISCVARENTFLQIKELGEKNDYF